MRLGNTRYFVPFFFVLNPALILRGELLGLVARVATAVLGIALIAPIASALSGLQAGRSALAAWASGRGVGWSARCCWPPA